LGAPAFRHISPQMAGVAPHYIIVIKNIRRTGEPKSSPKRMAAKEAGGGSRGRAPVLGATLKILALTAQMPHK
jgi:hypothetical protein